MIDKLQKKYADLILKPILKRYLKKVRWTNLLELKLKVSPTVFHPLFFFSSNYLAQFISKQELKGKRFLDVGCGSGIIALSAFKKGADVIAIDINKLAVENTKENFELNFGTGHSNFKVLQSNLFESLAAQRFDAIAINPPYFFKNAISDDQIAWNCGKNGEYFEELFKTMIGFIVPNTEIYMILGENCEIERIKVIAESYGFSLNLIEHRKIKWERNFIFKIEYKK